MQTVGHAYSCLHLKQHFILCFEGDVSTWFLDHHVSMKRFSWSRPVLSPPVPLHCQIPPVSLGMLLEHTDTAVPVRTLYRSRNRG